MAQPFQPLPDDRPCPLAFVILPTFIGLLLWLSVIVASVP